MKMHPSKIRLIPGLNLGTRGLAALACAVTVAAFVAQNATATPFIVSQMVGFSTGNLGAVGTAEKWNGSSGNVTVTSGSGSLNGVPVGLYPSAGDMASIGTGVGTNTYNLFAT